MRVQIRKLYHGARETLQDRTNRWIFSSSNESYPATADILTHSRCPTAMTLEQGQQLVNLVTRSKSHRFTPQLSSSQECCDGQFSHYCVRSITRRHSFNWYWTRRKSPLIIEHNGMRFASVLGHVDWALKRWDQIPWSGGTGTSHKDLYITRRVDDAFESDCTVEK